MIEATSPLVIGIGNILLRDEGVGVRVVVELERLAADGQIDVPSGTRFVDGGTLGLELLPMFAGASALVLVDAVTLRLAPGSVVVIRGDAIEGTLAGHVSPHQVGVADLVAAARLTGVMPKAASLVGVVPAEIAIGLDLTPAVEAAVPKALAAVRAELGRFIGPTLGEPAGGGQLARTNVNAAARPAPSGLTSSSRVGLKMPSASLAGTPGK
jgi:hydrogenase maturation protease